MAPMADLQHVSNAWAMAEDVDRADEKYQKQQERNAGAGEPLKGDLEPP